MAIDPVSAAASLFILKSKTRNQAIRNRMLELWKDRTKDPTSQWKKVRKSLGDIGLEAAALKEAQRIWKLHRKDQTRSGSVRDDRKTFDKSADQIYIVKPNTEVKLDRFGNYSGRSGYWQELPIQPDGSRMTQLQFHRTFPQYFPTKKSEAKKNQLQIAKKNLPIKGKDEGTNEVKVEDLPQVTNKAEANAFLKTGEVPSSPTVTNRDKPPLSFEQQLAQNLQGIGQRDFKNRDAATLKTLNLTSDQLVQRGISRFDQSDFLRDLRIGHAWDTGKGTIMYKPNRGMMKVIRKKKEEA